MATMPASTSASPRTSSNIDSSENPPTNQDDNGASEMSIDEPQTQSQAQQHQSTTEKQQLSNIKQLPQANYNNSIEQKRPMNAFLLFCKQQRSSVKEKHPNLENREITRILGDWWSKLDKEQKSKYTDMARQHKQAFMEANPDFKWCKTTITPGNNNISSNHNHNSSNSNNKNDDFSTTYNNRHQSTKESSLSPSADLHHSSSSSNNNNNYNNNNNRQQHEAPKPPKKRYLERNETTGYSKINPNDTGSSARDNIVPYLSLNQAVLDRLIEKALSEEPTESQTGSNRSGNSNGDLRTNNWNSSANVEPNTVTTLAAAAVGISASVPTTTTTSTTNSTSPSYSNGDDEPVDFSMKVTFRTTNQLIIDNVIEKAFSGSVDVASGTSRSSDVGSVHSSQLGPSIRRVNAEIT